MIKKQHLGVAAILFIAGAVATAACTDSAEVPSPESVTVDAGVEQISLKIEGMT